MKTHYIYGLRHPITKELRYVSQSTDPARRLVAHIYAGRKLKRTRVAKWIASLITQGLLPEQQILFTCADSDYVTRVENASIKGLKERGYRLTNVAVGSYRGSAFRPEEVKERLRQRLKDYRDNNPHPHLGKKQKPSTIKKRSDSMLDVWDRPGYREKCIEGMTGKKRNLTPEQRAKRCENSASWWQDNEKAEAQKAALAERNKANWANPEFREKMRIANQSKKDSESRKQQKSESAKARWADPEFKARTLAAIAEGKRRRKEAANDVQGYDRGCCPNE